jgi:hypothetical protein
MAKRIAMTRERMIALPTIIRAARAHLAQYQGDGKAERELRQALEAFRDDR